MVWDDLDEALGCTAQVEGEVSQALEQPLRQPAGYTEGQVRVGAVWYRYFARYGYWMIGSRRNELGQTEPVGVSTRVVGWRKVLKKDKNANSWLDAQ